jgi:hypothetical protein
LIRTLVIFLLCVWHFGSFAAVTITFSQVGSNVQAVATGILNLTGLSNNAPGAPNARVRAAGTGANVVIGPISSSSADGYTPITGPNDIGTSTSSINADLGSGGPFGINMATPSRLLVPQGFSGGSVSATSTWSNSTMVGLGLSPGTYVYTWPGDSLTIIIPTPNAIPTLDDWAKLLMALMMFLTWFWHHRKNSL